MIAPPHPDIRQSEASLSKMDGSCIILRSPLHQPRFVLRSVRLRINVDSKRHLSTSRLRLWPASFASNCCLHELRLADPPRKAPALAFPYALTRLAPCEMNLYPQTFGRTTSYSVVPQADSYRQIIGQMMVFTSYGAIFPLLSKFGKAVRHVPSLQISGRRSGRQS